MNNANIVDVSATNSMNFEADITVQVLEAIKASVKIPDDAKEEVKNFVVEKINELIEQAQAANLLEFPIPESLIDIWPEVIKILVKFM